MNTHSEVMAQANELVSIVAHDLRNPLMCIGGTAGLLMAKDRSPAERSKMLARIVSCSRFMEQIIGDILDSAALERDDLPMDKSSVTLPELLQKSLELMEHSAAGRGAALVLAVSNVRHPVLGDAVRLQQVLVNLVSNAIKHVEPGTGKVSVRLHDLGAELVVEVSDNGAGIAPEHLGRIFEKFYQAGEEKARGSLGLGLFIARRIVDLHGGRMWVRSAGPGKGASFYFSLPKHDPERAFQEYRMFRGCVTPPPRLFTASATAAAARSFRFLYPVAVAGVLVTVNLLVQHLPGRWTEITAYAASTSPAPQKPSTSESAASRHLLDVKSKVRLVRLKPVAFPQN